MRLVAITFERIETQTCLVLVPDGLSNQDALDAPQITRAIEQAARSTKLTTTRVGNHTRTIQVQNEEPSREVLVMDLSGILVVPDWRPVAMSSGVNP